VGGKRAGVKTQAAAVRNSILCTSANTHLGSDQSELVPWHHPVRRSTVMFFTVKLAGRLCTPELSLKGRKEPDQVRRVSVQFPPEFAASPSNVGEEVPCVGCSVGLPDGIRMMRCRQVLHTCAWYGMQQTGSEMGATAGPTAATSTKRDDHSRELVEHPVDCRTPAGHDRGFIRG
jgi:hypothetical protein